jgi:hypothetical protein
VNAHDKVMAAILAALRRAPAVTSGVIDEDVDAGDIAEEVNQCVSVSFSAADPQRPAIRGNPVYWQSTYVFECFARADGNTPRGRASRELHRAVYARLMSDPSLGGVTLDILEPNLRNERDQQDNRLGCVIASYALVHRTSGGTLE